MARCGSLPYTSRSPLVLFLSEVEGGSPIEMVREGNRTEKTTAMEYEDFEIRLETAGSESCCARVVSSPAGPGRRQFGLPKLRSAVEALRTELRHRRETAHAKDRHRDPPREVDAEETTELLSEKGREVGQGLFDAVFADEVLDLYFRSLDVLGEEPDRGLRIKLSFDPTSPTDLSLCGLPWELLYRAATRESPALSHRTPVVRHLVLRTRCRRPPFEPPLRILVVSSNPSGTQHLELQQELAAIEAAAGGRPGIEVVAVQSPTPQGLRDALEKAPFHYLHFMGHGSFEGAVGKGHLVLETHEGGLERVSGEDFVTLLRDHTSLRLVVLNACLTAAMGSQPGPDPFAGVATALMMAEIPMVLGMQFPIPDSTAITFSRSFYKLLLSGDSVDAAVVEARHAVRNEALSSSSFEWAIPVLFTQLPGFPEEPPWPVERLRVRRALEGLSPERFKKVRRRIEPRDQPSFGVDVEENVRKEQQRERAERLMNLAIERGEASWIALQESALAVRSPFTPFKGTFRSWKRHPVNGWNLARDLLVGFGRGIVTLRDAPKDLQEAVFLIWDGPRFHDGEFCARLWLPTLGNGGTAGLLLGDREWGGLVLGLLRSTSTGVCAEIHQQESLGWRSLISRKLLNPAGDRGWHRVALRRIGEEVELGIGAEDPVSARLHAELPAGHPGIVRFGGTAVDARDLLLTVFEREGTCPVARAKGVC